MNTDTSRDTILHPTKEYKPIEAFKIIKPKVKSVLIHTGIVYLFFAPICILLNTAQIYGLILVLAPTVFIIFEAWLELNINFMEGIRWLKNLLKKKKKK